MIRTNRWWLYTLLKCFKISNTPSENFCYWVRHSLSLTDNTLSNEMCPEAISFSLYSYKKCYSSINSMVMKVHFVDVSKYKNSCQYLVTDGRMCNVNDHVKWCYCELKNVSFHLGEKEMQIRLVDRLNEFIHSHICSYIGLQMISLYR